MGCHTLVRGAVAVLTARTKSKLSEIMPGECVGRGFARGTYPAPASMKVVKMGTAERRDAWKQLTWKPCH